MKELEKDYGGITMELGLYDLKSKTWEDYGISKARRMELQAFCLQYWEKMSAIQYGPKPILYDDMPHGAGISDPTELQAERNAQNIKDCELIEECAMLAHFELYQKIIDYVTTEDHCTPPISAPVFNGLIRYFFHILDLKKRR